MPLELAPHLVHGAVAHARSLGFEPDPQFPGAVPYLGRLAGPCPIAFGAKGSPPSTLPAPTTIRAQ